MSCAQLYLIFFFETGCLGELELEPGALQLLQLSSNGVTVMCRNTGFSRGCQGLELRS